VVFYLLSLLNKLRIFEWEKFDKLSKNLNLIGYKYEKSREQFTARLSF
jgi:hypothetical protein